MPYLCFQYYLPESPLVSRLLRKKTYTQNDIFHILHGISGEIEWWNPAQSMHEKHRRHQLISMKTKNKRHATATFAMVVYVSAQCTRNELIMHEKIGIRHVYYGIKLGALLIIINTTQNHKREHRFISHFVRSLVRSFQTSKTHCLDLHRMEHYQ